jgi:hypothetical protein
MTLLTFDTHDSRAGKALQIAAGAGQWIKCRTKDGQPFAFGVPSQRKAGIYYLVTTERCQCVDFKRRGQPCKHIAAVAIFVALKRAERSRRTHNGRGVTLLGRQFAPRLKGWRKERCHRSLAKRIWPHPPQPE